MLGIFSRPNTFCRGTRREINSIESSWNDLLRIKQISRTNPNKVMIGYRYRGKREWESVFTLPFYNITENYRSVISRFYSSTEINMAKLTYFTLPFPFGFFHQNQIAAIIPIMVRAKPNGTSHGRYRNSY